MSGRWRYLRILVPAAACSFFLYNAVRVPAQRTLSIVLALLAAVYAVRLGATMRPKR